MPIKLLTQRLANQIAAGEVIDRPASVVKELLENSLDAGATKIDIAIERGGKQLIMIRDDGSGIAHDELTLALSRHATSKIATLDDLSAIQSLGFRGEALASMSSVSRLVISSKPKAQADAWQAVAEGRDMSVRVRPVSHPDGSTVMVRDLFFNTPARRKFLRSDKTEWQHIDEVIKRIALANFAVAFTVTLDNKAVYRLPAATTPAKQQQRVSQLFGKKFVQQALAIDIESSQLRLWGWLGRPSLHASQSQQQYFYINDRMVRDRVLNHAVRQAYGDQLPSGRYPYYILHLQMDPSQLDVNVHPTKHEVRFQQTRLVHDFIVNAVIDALQTGATSDEICSRPSPMDYTYPLPKANTSTVPRFHVAERHSIPPSLSPQAVAAQSQPMHLLAPHYAIYSQPETLEIIDLDRVNQWRVQQALQAATAIAPLASTPLLMPIVITADVEAIERVLTHEASLQHLGLHLDCLTASQLRIRQIADCYRFSDIADLIQYLIAQPACLAELTSAKQCIVSHIGLLPLHDLRGKRAVSELLHELPSRVLERCRYRLDGAALQQLFSSLPSPLERD